MQELNKQVQMLEAASAQLPQDENLPMPDTEAGVKEEIMAYR